MKVEVTLADMKSLRTLAQRNGTEREWGDLILEWAAKCVAALEAAQKPVACAACESSEFTCIRCGMLYPPE